MSETLDLKNGLLRLLGYAVALVGAAVAGVLALFFAATVVVMAVSASGLIGFTALALRARRTARVRADGIIEARRVGHTWVAYAWNEASR